MFIHDRLTARQWVKWQEPVNWVASACVMAVLFFILMQFSPALLAYLIALGIATCLFFLYLDRQAIGIVCPHCKRPIETNTPWLCGYKGCRNENADDFPFIYECEHCRAKPKAYKCHHRDCEKLIFFTKDEQTFNYAQCINMPVPKSEPKPVKRDEHVEDLTKRRKVIERKELELKEANLDFDLKGVRQALEPPKTLKEQYLARVKNADDAKLLYAEIEVRFADDPAEREMRRLIVDEIMRDRI